MDNVILKESGLPWGAPAFDQIKDEDFMPAFRQAISEAKAEIDAITSCPEEPDYANTIEALEFSGSALDKVSGLFFNLLEADSSERRQQIAEEVSPMLTEYEMYVSLNGDLFRRVDAVWQQKDSLDLPRDAQRLLEQTWKDFVRGGARLQGEDKKTYAALNEELSLLELRFGRNLLAATNAYVLHLTDPSDLEGLPEHVREMGAATAAEKGLEGWAFDLSAPSYSAFMKYSARRELRRDIFMAFNSRAYGGKHDNADICRRIALLRQRIAALLGYGSFADYVLEDRMAGSLGKVRAFMAELLEPSLPAAREEVAQVLDFARSRGFEGERLEGWDFSYWSEKLKDSLYSLDDGKIKPYLPLESCIPAVFGLATRLYGLQFTRLHDIPVYHPDVQVFDVRDRDGVHKALLYCDFFPRASKRSGAWMTEFRGQEIRDGREPRPLVSLVTNFSKPTADAPSLLTHNELTTLLHEFGHSLHAILSEGRYGSLTTTNVDHDFVELPSQIMENWGYEAEFLKGFARHYKTGETMPESLLDNIVASKNFNAAYFQVRQLQFGLIDLAWHTVKGPGEEETAAFEKAAIAGALTLPSYQGTCTSTSFSHIFSGGYCAGYYSYKWAEVLEADAFSLFEQKGIFNTEVAESFRREILSRGSTEDERVLYRNFRGHDPEPKALLLKLGIVKN